MASEDSSSVAQRASLYAEVLKFAQSSDYSKCVKASNRVLHEFPEEALAFQVKMTSLVHLGKFQEVLDFVYRNPKFAPRVQYEVAYCYYRLKKTEDALETINKLKDRSWKTKELLAQIMYRLERFDESFDLYKEVIKNTADEFEDERLANSIAVMANLDPSREDVVLSEKSCNTYEQLYNYCYALIVQEKYEEAKEAILKSEVKCREALRDDIVAEDEIEEELDLIQIQKAYCDQKLGNLSAASNVYSKYLKVKPENLEILGVGSCNMLALNGVKNIFDARRRLKGMLTEGVSEKLNGRQDLGIQKNHVIADYLADSYDECLMYCRYLYEKYPAEEYFYQIINSGVSIKTLGTISTLQKLKDKRSPHNLHIHLDLAQHCISINKFDDAIIILENLENNKYIPGVISAIVTLYRIQLQFEIASETIRQAIGYYRQTHDYKNLIKLGRIEAFMLMEEGHFEAAIEALEELREIEMNDVGILALLVDAYIEFDAKKAEALSAELPPVRKPAAVNWNELESSAWLSYVKSLKKGESAQAQSSSRSGVTVKERKIGSPSEKPIIKKKKKNKIPANADGHPDTERWLPKYERVAYRQKRSRAKGKVDVGKGTQGVSSEAAAAFDMSSKPSTSKSSSTPPVTPKSTGSGGSGSKSKGKGKRTR